MLTASVANTAAAAVVEKLFMPGPVASDHAHLEAQCASCHDTADRARQTDLCLDCHEETAADVANGSGFHGKMVAAQTGQCQACHTEHRGREADIVRLNAASFDHRFTDFPLSGAHRSAACESCHEPGIAFRETPSRCIDCHRNDDVHREALGSDCQSCHADTAWQHVKLDHSKTRFTLRDRHREVPCAACHAGQRYADTPMRCVACHAADDIHRGSRGEPCGDCHTTVGWDTAKFDHARETGFALLGQHEKTACADCHKSGNMKDELPRECSGCHRSDDRHAGRFGAECADCHGNETWRVAAFDHAKRSDFALEGPHADLDCHSCHTAPVAKQDLPTNCAGCHAADDVHGGALAAACDQCHAGTRWSTDNRFDHDLSNFPLHGLHVVVTCAQCHANLAFKGSPRDCNGCHARRDVHNGSLGPECNACHSPNGWDLWQFDHRNQTGFALTGAHQSLSCSGCHMKPAAEAKLSRDCASCHLADDVHGGQFGRQCERCHSTSTFLGARAR